MFTSFLIIIGFGSIASIAIQILTIKNAKELVITIEVLQLLVLYVFILFFLIRPFKHGLSGNLTKRLEVLKCCFSPKILVIAGLFFTSNQWNDWHSMGAWSFNYMFNVPIILMTLGVIGSSLQGKHNGSSPSAYHLVFCIGFCMFFWNWRLGLLFVALFVCGCMDGKKNFFASIIGSVKQLSNGHFALNRRPLIVSIATSVPIIGKILFFMN